MDGQGQPEGVDMLAETESYAAWMSQEEDGATIIHLELGQITLHFYRDEYEELAALMDAIADTFAE